MILYLATSRAHKNKKKNVYYFFPTMRERNRSCVKKCLKVHEILLALENENDSDTGENLIYVEPPIERSEQAEDSDASDDEHGANLNHLGRNLLQSRCEPTRDDALSTILSTNVDEPLLPSSLSSGESDDEDNEPLLLYKRAKSRQIKVKLKKKDDVMEKTTTQVHMPRI